MSGHFYDFQNSQASSAGAETKLKTLPQLHAEIRVWLSDHFMNNRVSLLPKEGSAKTKGHSKSRHRKELCGAAG